jgi:hypothetical protein
LAAYPTIVTFDEVVELDNPSVSVEILAVLPEAPPLKTGVVIRFAENIPTILALPWVLDPFSVLLVVTISLVRESNKILVLV